MAKGKRKSRKAKKTVRPFKCKYCFKHFASMPSRSKHHANIHFEIHSVMRYTRAIKGIECKLCSRRYSCKQSLCRHTAHKHKELTKNYYK